jgi:hypothetical protein
MAEAAFNGSTKVHKNLKVREKFRARAKLGGGLGSMLIEGEAMLYGYKFDVAQDDLGRLGSFVCVFSFKPLGLGTMICRSCMPFVENGSSALLIRRSRLNSARMACRKEIVAIA